MSWRLRRAVPAIVLVASACGGARATVQAPDPIALPPAESTDARRDLLDSALIARLPPAEREAWTAYVAKSRATRVSERAALNAEVTAAGMARMIRAPYMRRAFEVTGRMSPEWFRSDSGRAMASNILSFQTPSGGWSKHIDFSAGPRRPGQSYYSESDGWSYIATIDNGATTSQVLFLAAAYAADPDDRYRVGMLRGVNYLLDAQFPNGCFPQVYPLQGGYNDAATFNDDATVNVLRILRDIGRGRHPLVPADMRSRVAAGLERGVECIIRSQILVNGQRTGWGQQHHPVTLAPVPGRSYELVGLSGRESAGITEFLMSLSRPEQRVVDAVHAAVDWLRKTQIHGYVYDFDTGLAESPGGGPIWARLYEIGTDRPIFSNRDGVKLYDWNQLTDRRQGYGWFGEEPADVLKKYDESWAARYPRTPAPGAMHRAPRRGLPVDAQLPRTWRQRA